VALQALSENPREEWAREVCRAAGRWTGNCLCWWTPTRSFCKLQGQTRSASGDSGARLREGVGNPEAAIARNRGILEIADATSRRAGSRTPVHCNGQHDQLLAIYDKKLALAGSRRRSARFVCSSRPLYEEQYTTRTRRSISTRTSEDGQRGRAGATAWTACIGRRSAGRTLAKIIARELQAANDDPSAAELKFRPGRVSEKHLKSPGVAVEAYQEALALDATHAGARAALEIYLDDSQHQMRAVAALEPIYEAGHESAVAAGSAHQAGARDGCRCPGGLALAHRCP